MNPRGRGGRVRRAAKWAGILASGAALTVAVSWAVGTVISVGGLDGVPCARKSAPGETRFQPELVYLLERAEGPGIRWLIVGIQRGAEPDDWLPDPELRVPTPEAVLGGWALRRFAEERRAFERRRNPVGYFGSAFEARGWPLPALWCAHGLDAPSVQGGFEIGGAHRAPPHTGAVVRRTLPFRPLWSGLLVDTAFWSGAAASLLLIPAAIRRTRRRRARLCVSCGYDLAGLSVGAPCPECGASGAPEGGTRM